MSMKLSGGIMTQLTKSEIEQRLYTPIKMKSKNITHIVLEGINGIGKSSLVPEILKQCRYSYVVYDRGEISNYVYAKKYNRPFISLQRNLPFIYVLLICDEKTLQHRLSCRNFGHEDVNKFSEQELFIQAANDMKNDFHIVTLDTSLLSLEETAKKILSIVDEYKSNLQTDETETDWNKSYRKACENLHLKFEVRENQPYINNKPCMSESTWQNGYYETFSDKETFPDNLLFSLTYSTNQKFVKKSLDFAYVINSKINRRPEIIDYYLEFLKNDKTCLVSDKVYEAFDQNPKFEKIDRVFGNQFIEELSKAKATVYCARDLEYLKLQTARLYEGILANQIIFVDFASDKDREILRQIHKDDYFVNLLTVNPYDICEKYDRIMADGCLRGMILANQKKWYLKIRKNLVDRFGGKDE